MHLPPRNRDANPPSVTDIVDALLPIYGPMEPPPTHGIFEAVLWEVVAYLADDDRRAAAWELLKQSVGARPEQILAASHDALLNVGRYGIMAEQSVVKMRQAAKMALTEFDDVESSIRLPLPKARKALQKFPSIGQPSADKILLITRAYPVFALESNGLRTMCRLGFGHTYSNYGKTYRSVMAAASVARRDEHVPG